MKNWFTTLLNGVLQNILATFLIAIAIPVFGIVYAFSTSEPQITLLIVIIILLIINTINNSALLRKQSSLEESIQKLNNFKCSLSDLENPTLRDPLAEKFSDELDIIDKRFDEQSSPQKLVIRFRNRGHSSIQITRVKYSAKKLELSALLPLYKMEDRHHYLIPVEPSSSQIDTGNDFVVEIGLTQVWKSEDFNRMAGDWGYLRIEAIYEGKLVEKFTSI